MRILLTNHALTARAGSELWVRDVALALLARGHAPVVYSRRLGEVAGELRRATVPVVDDLDRLGVAPHLIHAHHHLEAMTALLRFPGVPAIAVCHGWLPAEEAPPAFPRILRYVAVDDLVHERLVAECGIPAGRIVTLRNFVDLRRFRFRPPLPARPRRALVLSNRASEDTFLPAVRAACSAAGIALDVAGLDSGRPLARPEEVIGDYDVIFAKGRAALEAAAVGGFVVLCDAGGLGPAVTSGNVERVRALNFGVRLLRDPISADAVASRLALYDPAEATAVRESLRAEAGLDAAVDRLLALYTEVLAEHAAAPPADLAAELAAASRYLRHGPLTGGDLGRAERERLQVALGRAAGEAEARREELARLAATCEAMRREIGAPQGVRPPPMTDDDSEMRAQLAATQDELTAVRAQRDWMAGTPAWRWRTRLVSRPMLVGCYRWLRGLPPIEVATQSSIVGPSNQRPPVALPASLGERAERMVAAGGFLGVPIEQFEEGGRAQLIALVRLGLLPGSKVLDLGCGVLRAGYWLIHFLDPGCYCGVEPHRQRVELGLDHLLEPGLAATKRPRFDHNARFDSAVFGEKFDFFLAYSIWTHAAKQHIATMLDGFLRDSAPEAVFLTSYLPAGPFEGPDYEGHTWVGTSHESTEPGVIRHRLSWIQEECSRRGLEVGERPEDDFGGQRWLAIRRNAAGHDDPAGDSTK